MEGQRLTLQMLELTKKHMYIKLYKTDSSNLFPTGSPEQTKKESKGLWITKPLLSNQGFFPESGGGGDTNAEGKRGEM